MGDEEEPKLPQVNSWTDLLQGGLPQLIAGPAGKAISRLIAGATDIPAAWLEQVAQGIRDTTEAKTRVMAALAEKSAELGLQDNRLLARGLDNLLHRAYREQENREAVAREAVEQLEIDPPPQASAGPSDDWLNIFEEKASKASSGDLRALFGKVLAGEIRVPGSFSPATLHFVSILDQETAALIELVGRCALDGTAIPSLSLEGRVTLSQLLALEDVGFLSGASGGLSMTYKYLEPLMGFVISDKPSVYRMRKEQPGGEISFDVYTLSKSARELLSALAVEHDAKAIEKVFWAAGISSLEIGFIRGGRALDFKEVERPNT